MTSDSLSPITAFGLNISASDSIYISWIQGFLQDELRATLPLTSHALAPCGVEELLSSRDCRLHCPPKWLAGVGVLAKRAYLLRSS